MRFLSLALLAERQRSGSDVSYGCGGRIVRIGSQGVEGRPDLRVLVRCRRCQLFERRVDVCGRQREVVEVAVQLRHQVHYILHTR